MKKIIVFNVEDVLVKSVDVEKMDEMKGRKMVKSWVGVEMYEKEFVKEGNDGVMKLEEMVERMVGLEKRFDEEGDNLKRFWMRELRRKLEGWLELRCVRLEELKRKYLDGFEKRVIGIKNELKDLERICEVVGGKMVFVSKERKSKVVGLLMSNGLKVFEVSDNMDFLEGMDEKEVVVFESVEELNDMWGKIGLKRA
jgi:hypothetical protein